MPTPQANHPDGPETGRPVVPGTTILDTGHSLVWTPSAKALGDVPAFTVSDWDGLLASATPVTVAVRLQQALQFAPGGDSNLV